MKNILLVFSSSILSAILAIFIYRYFEEPQEIIIREVSPAQYVNLDNVITKSSEFISAKPTDFIITSENVTSAVVNIRAEIYSGFSFLSNGALGASSGSGVIISEDGYIVTNNHVVEEGSEIQITLSNKQEYEAKKIGVDPSTDLALLKIEANDLPFLAFGNSDSLNVGEWVLAVGNPFNLESTVTAGIVSAKGRNIKILEDEYSIESFIQTDAMVNPGNSGGALVNTNGDLIGINTAIMSRSGSFEGYSFAIPSNLANKVINDLKNFGKVKRGVLGVVIDEIDNRMANQLGLKKVQGVYIRKVTEGGGATKAGIQAGDVIVKISNFPVNSVPELQEQVARFRPGELLLVEYIRQGKKKTTTVKLQDIEDNDPSVLLNNSSGLIEELGLQIRNLKREEKKRLNISDGVKVISIYKGSKAEVSNMEIDFIIRKVNKTPVSNVEDFLTMLELSEEQVVLEGIYEHYSGEYLYQISLVEE